MDVVNFNKNNLNSYWSILKGLSIEAKLELAKLLIDSVKNNNSNSPIESRSEILDRLYGAWTDDNETAEELIAKIRESRVWSRKIEPLD